MGLFSESVYTGVAGGRQIACLFCQNTSFWTRRAKQSSSGAEFLDVAWASPEALVMTCTSCGFNMDFMPKGVELTKVKEH